MKFLRAPNWNVMMSDATHIGLCGRTDGDGVFQVTHYCFYKISKDNLTSKVEYCYWYDDQKNKGWSTQIRNRNPVHLRYSIDEFRKKYGDASCDNDLMTIEAKKNQGEMLARAIHIAAMAHIDQKDRAGLPYILHPLKVMHYLRTDDFELMQIAVLHDVVEDTDVTFDYLRYHSFSNRVINALECLTKQESESYEEYKQKIFKNRDAMLVKLADLRHNSDIRRLKGITEKDFKRTIKYQEFYQEIKQKLQETSS